jgi:hypothetical protein
VHFTAVSGGFSPVGASQNRFWAILTVATAKCRSGTFCRALTDHARSMNFDVSVAHLPCIHHGPTRVSCSSCQMPFVVGHAAQTPAEPFLPTCHDSRAPTCPRRRGIWARTCHPHHRCRGDDSRARGADDSKYYYTAAERSRSLWELRSDASQYRPVQSAAGRYCVATRRLDIGTGGVRSPRGGQDSARTLGQHTPALPLEEVRTSSSGSARRRWLSVLAECWPPSSERTQPVTMSRRRAATAIPQQTARSDTASAAPRVGV